MQKHIYWYKFKYKFWVVKEKAIWFLPNEIYINYNVKY